MVEQARASMTPEQLEEYKRAGEHMYDFDYTQPLVPGQAQPQKFDAEAIAYVVEGLKSGLHPSYLSDDEQTLMESHYGKLWYKQFGFDSIEI